MIKRFSGSDASEDNTDQAGRNNADEASHLIESRSSDTPLSNLPSTSDIPKKAQKYGTRKRPNSISDSSESYPRKKHASEPSTPSTGFTNSCRRSSRISIAALTRSDVSEDIAREDFQTDHEGSRNEDPEGHEVRGEGDSGRDNLEAGDDNDDELSDWGMDDTEDEVAVPVQSKGKRVRPSLKKKKTTPTAKTPGRLPRNGIQRELARNDAGTLTDPGRRVHYVASLQTKVLEPQATAEFFFYLAKVVEDSYAIPTILRDEKEGLAVLTARVSRSDVKNKVNELLGALDLMRLTWRFNT